MVESEKQINALLDKHKLKKTNPRVSVLTILSERKVATSQPYLEEVVKDEIDRVTLYRILKTFEEKGIIHKILDLNGTATYAMCSHNCSEEHHHDEHAHFNCTSCKNVFCLPEHSFSPIALPAGFKAEAVHLSVTGLCKDCQ